jgi:hypothetical protein
MTLYPFHFDTAALADPADIFVPARTLAVEFEERTRLVPTRRAAARTPRISAWTTSEPRFLLAAAAVAVARNTIAKLSARILTSFSGL